MNQFVEDQFVEVVKKLTAEILPDREILDQSFHRLQKKLREEIAILAEADKESVIPSVDFAELFSSSSKGCGTFSESLVKQIRRRGVVIVRGVFKKDEAEEFLKELKDYMVKNGEDPEDPEYNWYEIYWSKPQMAARTHPNMISVQKSLLQLWRTDPDLDEGVDLDQPMMYVDKMRMRKPGDVMGALRPHVDIGMLENFRQPVGRQTFSSIFSGHWESYDPFVVRGRGNIEEGSCYSFFRAFQGWTALTPSGPGEGTITFLPILLESTTFLILRAMLSARDGEAAGTQTKARPYYPSESLHAELFHAMVSLPRVEPGDTVWWHPNVMHSVEGRNGGSVTNSVLFIPAGPDCPLNRAYAARMRRQFEQGLSPPDFVKKPECELRFVDRAGWDEVSEEGKRMMGVLDEE